MNINSTKEFKTLLKKKGYKIREANQGWIRINCPSCSARDSLKLKRYVNPSIAYSHCFICQQQLFLHDLIGDQVVFTGIPQSDEAYEHPQAKEIPANYIIPINELPENHPAIEFLKKDHFSNFQELWENFGVCYIPEREAKEIKFDSGSIIKPGDSLLFPVMFNHKLVGWQCRFIPGTPNGDKFAKMKYFHIHNKGKHLYNYDQAKLSPYVVIFEGVKKSWKNKSHGVATLGKGITTDQIQLIQNTWKKIVFFLDSNAQEEADVQGTILRMNGREVININPADFGFKDPDEMTHEQVLDAINSKL